MRLKRMRRRQFLRGAPAMAGLAAGALPSAAGRALGAEVHGRADELRGYGERSRFVNSERVGSIGLWPANLQPRDYGFRTPLQDAVGIVTPAALHFVHSHGFDPPGIDPSKHRLLIHGMVERPLIFAVDELRRLPSVSRFHFLECHGNSPVSGPTGPPRKEPTATVQETHGLTSCSEWTGVLFSLLLKEIGVQKNSTWLVAEGADTIKHTKSIRSRRQWTTF